VKLLAVKLVVELVLDVAAVVDWLFVVGEFVVN